MANETVYTLIENVKSVIRKEAQLNDQLFEWQMLQEEKLEILINKSMVKAEKQMIDSFDTLFSANYEKRTEGFGSLIKLLLDTRFDPRIRYDYLGMYRFKWFTIPIIVRDFLTKHSGTAPGQILDVISDVEVEPFSTDMKGSTSLTFMAGGQSALATFDIERNFKVVDDSGLKWLSQYETTLATSMTQQISTKVRFELLEGMRNLESIPQIKNRVQGVWNESIDIIVPPKVGKNGAILRAGYSYSIPASEWATMVARTEVSRAFAMGRIEAFTQMGVVEKVQWLVSPDERLCPICGAMEGETFTLQEASNLIPIHPQCRCTWVPIVGNYANAREQANANLADLYSKAA